MSLYEMSLSGYPSFEIKLFDAQSYRKLEIYSRIENDSNFLIVDLHSNYSE